MKPYESSNCTHVRTHADTLTCKCEFILSIKAPPSWLLLSAICPMALLIDWNIKRAGKAAIKLIFNRSQLITFLCVCVRVWACRVGRWGQKRWLLGQFNGMVVTPGVPNQMVKRVRLLLQPCVTLLYVHTQKHKATHYVSHLKTVGLDR